MKRQKLAAFFVIAVLFTSILYPLNVIASPHNGEFSAGQIKDNKTNESHSDDVKPQGHPQHNVSKDKSDSSHDNDKKSQEPSSNQNSSGTQIAQTAKDEGDNRHPSGKDRSVEHGNSQTQGKSNSDPDGKENAYGGVSGKDKPGYDGGLDKRDQDGNNGCGNDDDFEDDNNGNCGGHRRDHVNKDHKVSHPQKNLGGCDKDGSTGDRNGRPCNPGKNNASETGCKHGEPDCASTKAGGKSEDKSTKNGNSSNRNSTIAYTININNQISITNQQSSNITNHQSTKSPSQVLGASTLAATGDYLLRVGFLLITIGIGSFMFGLLSLFNKAFNKIFKNSYHSYLYLYEA